MGENAITQETVLKDIQKIAGHFETLGPGTDLDRAAQLVVQPIQLLLRRLDDQKVLELLYAGEEAKKLLPEAVLRIVQGLLKEESSVEQARSQLQEVLEQYEEIFGEMGISPQISKMLFFK